jgi:hypothetical protein
MRESCSSGSVGAPPGNRWRYPDSDLPDTLLTEMNKS